MELNLKINVSKWMWHEKTPKGYNIMAHGSPKEGR